jgi:hypothetical protein
MLPYVEARDLRRMPPRCYGLCCSLCCSDKCRQVAATCARRWPCVRTYARTHTHTHTHTHRFQAATYAACGLPSILCAAAARGIRPALSLPRFDHGQTLNPYSVYRGLTIVKS